MKLGIVIINYNGANDTIECIESLCKHLDTSQLSFRIYLIDNNSLAPISESLLAKYNSILYYYKSEENTGFSGGNNIGIQVALNDNCNYVALINNDTVIIDDSIKRVLDKMENFNIDICGIVNYYYSNQSEIWQAGFNNNFRLAKALPINKFEKLDSNFINVDYVPGSSMVIKKCVFDKIGSLDPKYFAYYEENDFCVRAKSNGFRIAFLPNTVILHKVGKSSPSILKHYLRTRNMLLFYSKYSKKYVLYLVFFCQFLRTVKLFMGNNFKLKYFDAFFIGYNDFRLNIFFKGSIYKFLK